MIMKALAKSSHAAAEFGLAALLLMYVFATGCGGYEDFTLPELKNTGNLQIAGQLEPSPSLTRDQERDVLNPSVVRHGTVYYNFYSEFDGRTWRTALATSPDGSHWVKQGRVLSPDAGTDAGTWEGRYIAANGSALWSDGEFRYWYQAGEEGSPRIGLARSTDGRVWHKEPKPVIAAGPRGSWDECGVADPYVLKIGPDFYAYYLGQDRAHRQQLGLARSQDGVKWTKLRSNPVLTVPWPGSGSPDENGLGEPAVWQSSGWYWMVFTGRSATERRVLIAARSRDGVHWSRQSGSLTGSAAQAWDSQVICDPTVLLEAGRIRLWFGGGNVARPDENLNGQIGEGEIKVLPTGVSQ